MKEKINLLAFILANTFFIGYLASANDSAEVKYVKDYLNQQWKTANASAKLQAPKRCGLIRNVGQRGNNFATYKWQERYMLPATTNIGFDVNNKAEALKYMRIELVQNGNIINAFGVEAAGRLPESTLDISKPTTAIVTIKYPISDTQDYEGKWNLDFRKAVGKTIYITFRLGKDKNNLPDLIVYPQTGFGNGTLGVIDKCYLKDKNIKKDEIVTTTLANGFINKPGISRAPISTTRSTSRTSPRERAEGIGGAQVAAGLFSLFM